jgi:hypothetical protein
MKKVNVDLITGGVAYPPAKKGLKFQQQAYTEMGEDIIKHLIENVFGVTYDSSKGYILHGCILTDLGGSNFSLSAGAIFFNGEIYRVDAIAGIAIPDDAILNIVKTQDPDADPTTMSDNSTVLQIHDIFKLVLSNATLDSGDLNYDDLITINTNLSTLSSKVTVLESAWAVAAIIDADMSADSGTWNSGSGQISYKKTNNMCFIDVYIINTDTSASSISTFTLNISRITGVTPNNIFIGNGSFSNSTAGSIPSYKDFYTVGSNNINIHFQMFFRF